MLAAVVALWASQGSARAGQLAAQAQTGELSGQAEPAQEKPPPHAAGGWPTDTTADSKKTPRSAEQQAAIDEVAGELKRLARNYGPDSVVLQAKFLIRSVAAGAIGATEVRVAGPSSEAGPGHLEIDIETGMVFDDLETTPESRRETVWKDLAFPVLDEMASFKIEPPALELVFLFDVKHQGPEVSIVEATHHEAFRVRLTREVLDELAADQLGAESLWDRAQLTPAVAVPHPSRP